MSEVNLSIKGYMGKDPVIKTSSTGNVMASFSVAHNQGKKEENKPPIWFNFKAVGAAAKVIQYMSKGDKIEVAKAIPEAWVDKDGNQRLTWVVFQIGDGLPVIDVNADVMDDEVPF